MLPRFLRLDDGSFINPEHVASIRNAVDQEEFNLAVNTYYAFKAQLFKLRDDEEALAKFLESVPKHLRNFPKQEDYVCAKLRLADGSDVFVPGANAEQMEVILAPGHTNLNYLRG